MEQKNKRQGKNKGFSLVELIVVMAIMAILVGAIAPQVIKYVENARESRDTQVASNLLTALTTAIGSSEDTVNAFTANSINDTTAEYAKISTEVKSISEFKSDQDIYDVLKSKKGKAGWVTDAAKKVTTSKVTLALDANGKMTVSIGDISVSNK